MCSCIYCVGRREQTYPLTLEHIWPQALGGDYCPPIFQTNQVCERCNNLAGLFVDGAFLKSWFITSENVISAHRFLDPDNPTPVPLLYAGFDREFPVGADEVCERWIGPAHEHIYHIHLRDDPRWDAIAGGDFIRRKKLGYGRVYILLTSPSEYWSLTALFSVSVFFPKARRRCLTPIDGLPEEWRLFERLNLLRTDDPAESPEEAREIDWLLQRPTGRIRNWGAIRVDFADRFLAKLSVGLGHTILGHAVSASPYANELRRLLWSTSPEKREEIDVYGTGFWENGPLHGLSHVLKVDGAWTVFLSAVGTAYGMVLCTPGGRFMSMMISDDPSLWRADVPSDFLQGVFYIIVPQRRRSFGPVPLASLVSHQLGQRRDPVLAELEQLRTDPARLPSKELG